MLTVLINSASKLIHPVAMLTEGLNLRSLLTSGMCYFNGMSTEMDISVWVHVNNGAVGVQAHQSSFLDIEYVGQ